MNEELKLPPHNDAAEQSVLGAIFIKNESLDLLDGLVGVNDFYRADHRLIYESMLALNLDNKPIDLVTVSDWLEARSQIDQAGGIAYLGQIAHETPSHQNVKQYAKIVRDCAIARKLIQVGYEIAESGYSSVGIEESIESAQSAVMALNETSAPEVSTMREHLRSFVAELERRTESDNEIIGFPSGYPDLDKITGGFRKTDVIILAARPSMGKTTLAMNIAESGIYLGKSTLVFSAEMSGMQLTERATSALSRVNFSNIRSGRLADHEWAKVSQAINKLSNSKLLIDDRSAPSIAQIKAIARKTKRTQGLDLIIVDYLQLLAGKGENRTQEVGSLSRGLKAIAKELNVPVIVLSQLNRQLENRANKRPTLSDLRDSGEIEQDADLVMFLYRDEIYNPDSPHKGCAELIIAKHRNGSLGNVALASCLERMRFESLFDGLPEIEEPPLKRMGGFGRRDYGSVN